MGEYTVMNFDLSRVPVARCRFQQSSFQFVNRLNEGGMADLWSAYDGNSEQVAVRQLKPELRFNLKLRKRFRQGIEIRRNLGRHPNLVQYLGEGGRLQPFEVIEFVEGSSLKHLIFKARPVVRERQLDILLRIAEAIAHMHEVGYLHLDIKPENVLVHTGYDRDDLKVKLTDFDLAQPIDRRRAPKDFGGSLAYLPPEFLAGKRISPASDVFAFGVLTYHLFTSQMPFVGSVGTSMKNGIYSITFPTTQFGTVPQPIQDFIRRCLAPEPEQRYGDVHELRKGLNILNRKLAASV